MSSLRFLGKLQIHICSRKDDEGEIYFRTVINFMDNVSYRRIIDLENTYDSNKSLNDIFDEVAIDALLEAAEFTEEDALECKHPDTMEFVSLLIKAELAKYMDSEGEFAVSRKVDRTTNRAANSVFGRNRNRESVSSRFFHF